MKFIFGNIISKQKKVPFDLYKENVKMKLEIKN